MTSQQIGLLCLQAIVSLAVLAFIGIMWLRSQEDSLRFRFFAARDKLLYLAATGTLPQNSMVFKVFYRSMNTYIRELDEFTIVSFMRASIAVKSELEKENQQRLIDGLRRSDPQVQATANEFIQTVMDALRYNSPTLHILLAFADHCTRLYSLIRKVRPTHHFPVPVYDTYRYYETIHGRIRFAI